MELLMSILLLLGGVGVFLAGMGQMSSGMRESAGGGIRLLFNRISSNRYLGYGIGISATALVQSSSATTIMTIGLGNAEIIDTKQGSSIILGAKVGTTLTAFLFAASGLSKGAFSVGVLFSSLAFLGTIMLMVAKNDKTKAYATFLLGFGMLFLGLEVMDLAIGDSSSNLGQQLANLFAYDIFKNPLLLVVIGLVFTCVIQSSTAATAIFITLLSTNTLQSLDQALFLVLGSNIGTTADGLMASFTGGATGKRLAMFHLLSSTFGALLFLGFTWSMQANITQLLQSISDLPSWGLALYNLVYNIIYTVLLLPFLPLIVKFTDSLIKEKRSDRILSYLNPQILPEPLLAFPSVKKEIIGMGKLAEKNLKLAFSDLLNAEATNATEVFSDEERINALNREITTYLIRLAQTVKQLKDETTISAYHHVINDIERIGDHAKNFMELACELSKQKVSFSNESISDLKNLYAIVSDILALSFYNFEYNSPVKLKRIYVLENEVDALAKDLPTKHFATLKKDSNFAEVQIYFDCISELERIADHAVNIAFSTINPVGDEVLLP